MAAMRSEAELQSLALPIGASGQKLTPLLCNFLSTLNTISFNKYSTRSILASPAL